MAAVETVRVKDSNGGAKVINKADFDPLKHTLYVADPPAARRRRTTFPKSHRNTDD